MRKSILAPVTPVDPVAFSPVMLALSKARAMAWAVEKLGDPDSNLSVAVEDAGHPEEARAWLHGAVGDALREALDEIEREHRKTKDGA